MHPFTADSCRRHGVHRPPICVTVGLPHEPLYPECQQKRHDGPYYSLAATDHCTTLHTAIGVQEALTLMECGLARPHPLTLLQVVPSRRGAKMQPSRASLSDHQQLQPCHSIHAQLEYCCGWPAPQPMQYSSWAWMNSWPCHIVLCKLQPCQTHGIPRCSLLLQQQQDSSSSHG